MRLFVYPDQKEHLPTLLQVLGTGNRSDEAEWGHQIKLTPVRNTFSKTFGLLLKKYGDKKKALDNLHISTGAALFIEYFSEVDMGSELTPDMLGALADLNISLCLNHILYNP